MRIFFDTLNGLISTATATINDLTVNISVGMRNSYFKCDSLTKIKIKILIFSSKFKCSTYTTKHKPIHTKNELNCEVLVEFRQCVSIESDHSVRSYWQTCKIIHSTITSLTEYSVSWETWDVSTSNRWWFCSIYCLNLSFCWYKIWHEKLFQHVWIMLSCCWVQCDKNAILTGTNC